MLCAHSCQRPISAPHPPSTAPALQQALVGALLVGLVGDIGQVDTAEGRAVVQHDITHTETQDIGLQTLLKVLQEPRGRNGVAAKGQTSRVRAYTDFSDLSAPPITS